MEMQVEKELALQHLQQAEIELQRRLEASKVEQEHLLSQKESEHSNTLTDGM